MPTASTLTDFIESQYTADPSVSVSDRHSLALQVQYDLQHQQDWTSLKIHTHSSSPITSKSHLLPRPLISGLPPHHVYIHPDEQGEFLKQGLNEKDVPVEREWVLPTHLREKWSLRRFAEVFDAIGADPPGEAGSARNETEGASYQRTKKRGKRLLMAIVNDDSTIVYYIIHDGIVKPRQN